MLKGDSWEKPHNKMSFLAPSHSRKFADSFVISFVEVTVKLMVCNSCKTIYRDANLKKSKILRHSLVRYPRINSYMRYRPSQFAFMIVMVK